MRFGTEASFLENQKNIKKYLTEEIKKTDQVTVLSNENIVGRITPFDLPGDIKVPRALSILPDNTTLLISIRDIEGLLYSYYKLLVSHGYGEKAAYFFNEINALESSFGLLENFRLSPLIKIIKEQRPDIKIIIFDISNNDSVFSLKDQIGLQMIDQIENESFHLKNIEQHLDLNSGLYQGKRFLDWFEIHRAFPDAVFEEKDKYRASRSRHLHNSAAQLAFLEKEKDYKKEFMQSVPNISKEITEENKNFLNIKQSR
jgi:hypothetical protein